MNSVAASPNSSPVSADPGSRFALGAWITLSLLGVTALLANAPGPRRALLFTALLLCLVEFFRQRRSAWLTPVLPWAALVLASAAWSPIPATTAVDALFEVISPIAAGLLAMSLVPRLPRRWLWLPFAGLVVFAIPAVLGGLREHAGLWPEAPRFIANAYAGRGVASTAGLLLMLCGGALLALRAPLCGRLPLALGLLVLGLFLGVLGYNRSFWLALSLGLLPWLFALPALQAGRRRWLVLVCVGGLLALGAYVSHSARQAPQAVGHAAPEFAAPAINDDPRWQIWKHWGALALEQPWLGHGYGSRLLPRLGENLPNPGNEQMDGTVRHHAHNVLLNVFVQTGSLGLAALTWLFAGLWRLSARLAVDVQAARWRLAVLSLVLAALVKSLTDDFFWGPAGILMWLFVGIMLGLVQRRDSVGE